MKRSANFVLGLSAIIFAVAVVVVGRYENLQFYQWTTPGPAFLPNITACGMALCGLILVVSSLTKPAATDADRGAEDKAKAIWIFKYKELWNIIAVIGVSSLLVYFTKYLGLLTSLAIGIGVMAKLLGTPGWWKPIWVGVLSWVALYLIFDWFLKTPLPSGMFGF